MIINTLPARFFDVPGVYNVQMYQPGRLLDGCVSSSDFSSQKYMLVESLVIFVFFCKMFYTDLTVASTTEEQWKWQYFLLLMHTNK